MVNILSPNAIWSDFKIEGLPTASVIKEESKGDIILSYLNIKGKTTEEGCVGIAGVLVKNIQLTVSPAIIVLQDFKDGMDSSLAEYFAERGYIVLLLDVAGKDEGKTFYTYYPTSLAYANYAQVKDDIYSLKSGAKKSCWYEWTCSFIYALKYLSSLPFVTNVGAIGIGEAATVLWQAAAVDKTLACAVFTSNAGWGLYKNVNKFGDNVNPQFSDEELSVLAGIEPEAYATLVQCPSLTLLSANGSCDVDRAYDTVSRIPDKTYKALSVCVGGVDCIDKNGFDVAEVFFKEILMKNGTKAFPKETEISCEMKDGVCTIEVTPDNKKLKEVVLYAAEGEENHAVRCWKRVCGGSKTQNGSYIFNYLPYKYSGIVTFVANAKYSDGFIVSSNVIAKRFTPEQAVNINKTPVIYNSREPFGESIFIPAGHYVEKPTGITVTDNRKITVEEGPLSISGVKCKEGLLTFAPNSVKYKPAEDAILMFDVCCKTESVLQVKIMADFSGQRTEYVNTVTVNNFNVWCNYKFEGSSFKTQSGMQIKSLSNVQALEFYSDGEFLLNNVLWI